MRSEDAIELLPDYCFCRRWSTWAATVPPITLSAVRARPLWTILSSQRVSAGVVGWPATAPAAPLRGFLITDEFEPGVASGAVGGSTAFGAPADAVLRAIAVAGGPLAVHAGSVEDPPLARDAWRREIAVQLRDEYRPRVLAVRYEGIDRAGHLYLRARPRVRGRGQDGGALAVIPDRHYAFLDSDRAGVDTLGPDDVLWSCPVSAWSRRARQRSGRPGQPDGGFAVRPTVPLATARRRDPARLGSIVDVAPTVPTAGLPVATWTASPAMTSSSLPSPRRHRLHPHLRRWARPPSSPRPASRARPEEPGPEPRSPGACPARSAIATAEAKHDAMR